MEELSQVLKNNKIDDLTWFCSLSENELDLIISIKKLAIQRAKICGHQQLAETFDLKMLRVLGLVIMEHLKQRIQEDDSSLAPSIVQQLGHLDNCNLLKTDIDDDSNILDIEEVLTQKICIKNSKRKSRKRSR